MQETFPLTRETLRTFNVLLMCFKSHLERFKRRRGCEVKATPQKTAERNFLQCSHWNISQDEGF